jgi:hypothetical protein
MKPGIKNREVNGFRLDSKRLQICKLNKIGPINTGKFYNGSGILKFNIEGKIPKYYKLSIAHHYCFLHICYVA